MTNEVRPLGVKCNIQCRYCYQNAERDAGATMHRYDMEKMKAAILATGGAFTLFGGEPLLMPVADLEELWSWGYARFGRNALQTNGTLIGDKHLELFERYNVRVGMSFDGPGSLNDIRWAGSLARTRAATARAEAAMSRLCAMGRAPSLIVTLHRGNAYAGALETLATWFIELEALGVRAIRLHLLEVDSEEIRTQHALTDAQNIAALRHLVQLRSRLTHLRLSLFDEMRRLLQGDDRRSSCIWNACDPYTTRAVSGIEGNGQRTNCGRTNKEGVDFTKADFAGFQRYLALYYTPQSAGGCAGCRFFALCKGQCPGTAINGDWRNRTEHCAVWKTLFEDLEEELADAGVWTLSRSKRRRDIERRLIAAWSNGKNRAIADAVREIRSDAAGT